MQSMLPTSNRNNVFKQQWVVRLGVFLILSFVVIVVYNGRFLTRITTQTQTQHGSMASTTTFKNHTSSSSSSSSINTINTWRTSPPTTTPISSSFFSKPYSPVTTRNTTSSFSSSSSSSSIKTQQQNMTTMFPIVLSIVIDLTGELGNMLHHIAHGRGIQLIAQNQYNISSQLILRQAGPMSKTQRTIQQLKQCFPKLRTMNYTIGTSSIYNERVTQQRTILQEIFSSSTSSLTVSAKKSSSKNKKINNMNAIQESSLLFMPTGRNLTNIHESLSFLQELLVNVQTTLNEEQSQQQQQQQQAYHDTAATTTTSMTGNIKVASLIAKIQKETKNNHDMDDTDTTSTSTSTSSATTISLPFLHVTSFVNRNFFDLFYDDYRTFFAFDRNACCNQIPDVDESVFHFRNFLAEFPKQGAGTGLEELSPNKTAYELFGENNPWPATAMLRNINNNNNNDDNSNSHLSTTLKRRKKIAITTRFGKHPQTQAYVDALTERGFQVRVIANQSAVQDFCFLQSTQYELVGNVRSTFLVWAGLLTDPERTCAVRFYSMDSPSTRKKAERRGTPIFRSYNWTNPTLKNHIFFELYQSEELEEQLVLEATKREPRRRR